MLEAVYDSNEWVLDLDETVYALEVATKAAWGGDLPLLKWLNSTAPNLLHNEFIWTEHAAFDIAAERGHLETVQWLVTAFPDAAWPLGPACAGGHLEVIKWLHEHANVDATQIHHPPCTMTEEELGGCLDLNFREVESWASKYKAPEAVHWRFDNGRAPRPTNAMDWAAKNGHLDVLKWLHANRSDGCSSNAVNDAAEAGHMPVLLWLHTHYSDQFKPKAMDHAARGNHFEIVKWLHANRSEGCTTDAMSWAGDGGHLAMIQWLLENYNATCKRAAMSATIHAAGHGQLEVVKWLHANGLKDCVNGCSQIAMHYAAAYRKNDVVQWLYENPLEGYSSRIMDEAARNENFSPMRWVAGKRGGVCDKHNYVGFVYYW